ncbi:MAG TPA: hypothetical protein VJB57_07170 [Dehalococcoidia bacterium]|nr:hypothetical protein [Dehalococcoidia bacterium]
MTTNGAQAATQEESQELLALRSNLEAITSVNIDNDLIRAAQLGDGSFQAGRALFEQIQSYAVKLQPLAWQLLTTRQVDAVRGPMEKLATVLQQIKEFQLIKVIRYLRATTL